MPCGYFELICIDLNIFQMSKLYKLSEEPERKDFLDRLISLMEQQGKYFSNQNFGLSLFSGQLLKCVSVSL